MCVQTHGLMSDLKQPGERGMAAALAAVLLLDVGLRIARVLLIQNEQYSDSTWYDAAALRLSQLGEFGPSQPSAWFPPGYPFFLSGIYSVFGYNQMWGKVGNIALDAGTCLLTYLLGARFFSRQVAILAALIVAVWPNLIASVGILSSEPLSTFGFVLAIWIGTSKRLVGPDWLRWVALLGLVVACNILTRPVAVILLPAVALYWWLEKGSLHRAATLALAAAGVAAILCVGWTARNYRQFGQFIPLSTNAGYNFWQANQRFADGAGTFWPSVPRDDPEYQVMARGTEFEKNRLGYAYGIAYLRSNPWHPIRLFPRKIWLLWGTDTSGIYEGIFYPTLSAPSDLADWMRAQQHLVESASFRFYVLIMALAVAGVLLAPREVRRYAWCLASLPLLLLAFHFPFHALDRFHVPLAPFLAMLAALGVSGIWRSVGPSCEASRSMSDKKKILITEDDGFLRDLTSIVLRKQGFEVTQARDGEEALEIVPTLQPDLILMDVNMPNIDGYTVARRLRADAATASIPIIFLTAHSQEKDRIIGIEAGATQYLTKPFDNKVLVDLIKQTLA